MLRSFLLLSPWTELQEHKYSYVLPDIILILIKKTINNTN